MNRTAPSAMAKIEPPEWSLPAASKWPLLMPCRPLTGGDRGRGGQLDETESRDACKNRA